jgi:cytochrome c556
MGKNDPPKGTKESWNEFSTAYADSAAALDRAAQAKDRKAALEAHGQLAGSCTQCHKEHRRMGRGPGGGPPPS